MDERGHKRGPAACFVSRESERAATDGVRAKTRGLGGVGMLDLVAIEMGLRRFKWQIR